jgi:hypothetical protein
MDRKKSKNKRNIISCQKSATYSMCLGLEYQTTERKNKVRE